MTLLDAKHGQITVQRSALQLDCQSAAGHHLLVCAVVSSTAAPVVIAYCMLIITHGDSSVS